MEVDSFVSSDINDFGSNYGITVADFRCLGTIYGLRCRGGVGNRNCPWSVWSGDGSGTSTVVSGNLLPTSITVTDFDYFRN